MNKKTEKHLSTIEQMDDHNLSIDDVTLLDKLSHDPDYEVRMSVADKLISADPQAAEQTLLRLIIDPSNLVRASAYDSISQSSNIEVYNTLIRRFPHEKNKIAESYTLMAIVDVALNLSLDKDQVVAFLQEALKNETAPNAKACIYRGLCLMGKSAFLSDLLGLLASEDYHARCATVNRLEEVICDENRDLIITALSDLKKREPTVAVQSTIDRVLAKES